MKARVRLLKRLRELLTSRSEPLTMGPDNGDTEEWMGERFIWEPGDLDDEEAGR
ncbi:hypothetical protein ACFWWT_11950 [Streptomyces sp. NPDC058676]|uniref:hypothetical protein n=1 Tax=unclassified Streptomyces TaxID=2593676 RepID=UPI00365B7A0B